jgi:hypothetical protein
VAPVDPKLAAASYCSSSPYAAAASATVGKGKEKFNEW